MVINFRNKNCNLFTHGAPRSSQELVQKCLCIPESNWNLEMLVFKERGKPEYPEKSLSEQSREPTTNSTHIWRRVQESNPGLISGRWALSPLRHPCSVNHKDSVKALVNEDTLLPMMYLGLRKLGNICCGHKMFLNKIRNIFCVPDTKYVSATNVARAGKRGNICIGNNVSSFARAFSRKKIQKY